MDNVQSRRSFLKMLGLGLPAAAVAPTYFFSPIGGWKSERIVNPFDITYIETEMTMKFEPKFYYQYVKIENSPETKRLLEPFWGGNKMHESLWTNIN